MTIKMRLQRFHGPILVLYVAARLSPSFRGSSFFPRSPASRKTAAWPSRAFQPHFGPQPVQQRFKKVVQVQPNVFKPTGRPLLTPKCPQYRVKSKSESFVCVHLSAYFGRLTTGKPALVKSLQNNSRNFPSNHNCIILFCELTSDVLTSFFLFFEIKSLNVYSCLHFLRRR